ncbi:hypothetical protein ON010_g6283 [Phytophthora cinnamomi]|nr:hypothetical protein ON010_g6283 [Phytophthora cinnamomi]
MDNSHERPTGNDVVEWARWRNEFAASSTFRWKDSSSVLADNGSDSLLVIGVKTAVLAGFELRQAIRETWASKTALPSDVKVYFVGCAPRLDEIKSEEEREQIQNAVDCEKQTYGDLLTNELPCEDSNESEGNKVKAFLAFVTQTFQHTPFVMIADDSIYLRADRLASDLRKESRIERLYLGQMPATEQHNIFIKHSSTQSYPLFAANSHYILSMDCARFIAGNSERLQSVGGADDISIALWLLAIQVHVEYTVAFSGLQYHDCENGLLSLADLSSSGIRTIHANVISRQSFCYGLNGHLFLRRNATHRFKPHEVLALEIQSFVHDLNASQYLLVSSIISTRENAGIKVSYYPSAETFASYSRRACAETRTFVTTMGFKAWMCRSIVQKLRTRVQQQFEFAKNSRKLNPAFLELWYHNLFVAEGNNPFIVAYTPESSYASIVFECIFKTIFESHGRPILVVPEKTLHISYGNKPDVFIFSIFDADCDPMTNPECPQMIAQYMHQYLLPVDGSSKLMMISGEAIDTQTLDDRVPLLSSVSSVTRTQHVYLPVVSISFAERLLHTPLELLSPTIYKPSTRRFCAYLYARCERPHREHMFDLLNAMEPVDALGICAGSSRPPDKAYKESRYSKWFNDEAVILYQRYKFVIAFENSAEPGYLTEKLANPLLAGSVPIYLGNSTTASQLFNPDSYIDCGRFEELNECAEFVLKVHKSPKLYAQLRNERLIKNITAFNEAFSWHPSVPSRYLADKVAQMLDLDKHSSA